MIGLLIDAVVLVFLLQIMNQEDIGFGTAVIVALVTSIGSSLLALGLILVMGTAGIFVAAAIAAVLVGLALAALFGMEVKRAMSIGALFMVAHIGVALGLQMLLGR